MFCSRLNGNLKDLDPSLLESGQGPSEEYENLRRRIYSNTKEIWYYINHEIGKLIADEVKADSLQAILNQVADRKRSLLSDQEKLPELDGYKEWRETEAANVSELVQRRLKHLQNPPDCMDARKVICNLNKVGIYNYCKLISFCRLKLNVSYKLFRELITLSLRVRISVRVVNSNPAIRLVNHITSVELTWMVQETLVNKEKCSNIFI
ncbi:Alpha-(1,6)-fucosyltransferase [Papilio xuthus]|uniref:Alpha-(1,6)-fucosyltransferase n=1 Tax=Papilio xuthus TaxID=66420 RepID=A0A0N1ICY4_PAPXU|nr:Alpha-(1,6)-fucosyltransferase [Papilio xuthus]